VKQGILVKKEKPAKIQFLSDNKHAARLKLKLLVMFREINAAY
jgi:hypothetical protein